METQTNVVDANHIADTAVEKTRPAVDQLKDAAVHGGQAVKSVIGEAASTVKENLYPLPGQAMQALQKVEDTLVPASQKAWRSVTNYVRENPKKVIGLGIFAAVVGILLTKKSGD